MQHVLSQQVHAEARIFLMWTGSTGPTRSKIYAEVRTVAYTGLRSVERIETNGTVIPGE